MRLLMINLLATAVLLVSAGAASAYQTTLVATTPTAGAVGDIVSFDVFLDTQGQIGLTLFSVSLTYDPAVVAYRPDLSATNGYYPIYTLGAGKAPATWLDPVPFDGNYCTPGDPICATPPGTWVGNLPPIGGQLNIDFASSAFPASGLTGSVDSLGSGNTVAQLATVSFEIIGGGVSAGEFGFGYGGNVLSIDGTDVGDEPGRAVGSAVMGVPEPTTALLVGLGLVGLGVAGRRRA